VGVGGNEKRAEIRETVFNLGSFFDVRPSVRALVQDRHSKGVRLSASPLSME